jgi:uncharacterized protein (TIGR03435 family)
MKTKIAVFAFIAASAALAQTTPAFEVAVIKLASTEQFEAALRAGQRPHTGVTIDSNRVDMGYMSIMDIVSMAYSALPTQIAGPDTLKTERFDILAKLPAGTTEEQVPQMIQALLAERFGMKIHREKRETGIYALVVSKGGLNPKTIKTATALELAPEPQPGDRTLSTPFGKMTMRQTTNNDTISFIPGIGVLKQDRGPNGIHIEMSNLAMARFAQLLMANSDRPVIDKTGLTGSYAASFDISMDAPPPPPGGGDAVVRNPMFQAVEQMGLKLEPQKDQVEMIVIDHIEKTPTDN